MPILMKLPMPTDRSERRGDEKLLGMPCPGEVALIEFDLSPTIDVYECRLDATNQEYDPAAVWLNQDRDVSVALS